MTISEKLDEYNRILFELSQDLDNPDSSLSFISTLEDLIKQILRMYLSKYTFVKGLDFDDIAKQLTLDYFLDVKSGKLKVRKWSYFLYKNLIGQIVKKFEHPLFIDIDSINSLPDPDNHFINNSDDCFILNEIESCLNMIKLIKPDLTESELQILVLLALEVKLNPYLDLKGFFKHKESAKAITTILKYINYLRRFTMVTTTEHTTESNYILRALAGITISPLFLVLNLEDMAKVISTLGGQTIRIPTFDEMKKLIPLLVLFHDYKLKDKPISKIAKELNLNRKDVKVLIKYIDNVKFTDKEKQNLLLALNKFVELSKAQDSFISQRLLEIEDKLMKSSKTALQLYRSLMKEEAEGIENLLKLTKEIVEKLT